MLIVVYAHFSTWNEAVSGSKLCCIWCLLLHRGLGQDTDLLLSFTPPHGGLFMAFKSLVAETEAEPCVLVSVKNFPLISTSTQSSSGMSGTTGVYCVIFSW